MTDRPLAMLGPAGSKDLTDMDSPTWRCVSHLGHHVRWPVLTRPNRRERKGVARPVGVDVAGLLSALGRQCLACHIARSDTLKCQIAAWEDWRNACRVVWQFTTHDAQDKLRSLYPPLLP